MRVLGHLRAACAGIRSTAPCCGRPPSGCPPGSELVEFERLAEIPPFDEDAEAGPAPDAVRELREAIRDADAVLIATPEYNHSLPGQLKNALDWASRPAGESALTASRRRRSAPRRACSAASGRRPSCARCWARWAAA